MNFVVERMQEAGCDELVVVTRAEKLDVVANARALGARVVEASPPTLARSILIGLEDVASDDRVLIGLPDTLWEPREGFAHLLAALDDDAESDVALGVFASKEPERSDVVVLERGGRVASVHVKPQEPPGRLVWGCVAARAGALQPLEHHEEPGHLFDELARAGRVSGVRFAGELIDIGTRAGLERAVAELAPA